MGYNLAKLKMKKLFLFVVSLFCITMTVIAQDASGSCKLPGTYDYVNVDYYRDGHLAVSNQSGMVITQLRIQVTAVETWDANGKPQKRTKSLCDRTYYDIPPYQTTRITDGVQTFNEQGYVMDYKYKLEVSVGNPICKQSKD